MELAAGVREHLQAIKLGLAGLVRVGSVEGCVRIPARLPFGFNLGGRVPLLRSFCVVVLDACHISSL